MILKEHLNQFQPPENNVVRNIPDGEPVPQVGDVIWMEKKGKQREQGRIVQLIRKVPMHKMTMYVWSVRPISYERKEKHDRN